MRTLGKQIALKAATSHKEPSLDGMGMISGLTMAEAAQTTTELMTGLQGLVEAIVGPMLSQTGQWETLE